MPLASVVLMLSLSSCAALANRQSLDIPPQTNPPGVPAKQAEAERGQYREAILEAGKLPRDSALLESLIQSWATHLNLTGKWWLCGVIGRATITDDPSLVEIYQSSMSAGDPAQQSYCIQISSSQPSFSGN